MSYALTHRIGNSLTSCAFGVDCLIDRSYSSITGGFDNNITGGGQYHLVGGGASNLISGEATSHGIFIGGGGSNQIKSTLTLSNYYSSIVGGQNNLIDDSYNSFIGGGSTNRIYNGAATNYAVIVGGDQNQITGSDSFLSVIGGGRTNLLTGVVNYSFIGGGLSNTIQGTNTIRSFIGTGGSNRIGAASGHLSYYGFIGTGFQNLIEGSLTYHSTIVNGNDCAIDSANAHHGFIGNGDTNRIQGSQSNFGFIGNGDTNICEGHYSSVLNGQNMGVHSMAETTFGIENVADTSGNENALVADDWLFTIGNGSGVKSNALTIQKSGFTQINTTGFTNALVVADVTPDGALDIVSTTGSLILPRMTHTQAAALSTVNGSIVYVTSTDGTFTSIGFWGYENGSWVKL